LRDTGDAVQTRQPHKWLLLPPQDDTANAYRPSLCDWI
jgi:hypothetical protein